jgi:hypothetical protein
MYVYGNNVLSLACTYSEGGRKRAYLAAKFRLRWLSNPLIILCTSICSWPMGTVICTCTCTCTLCIRSKFRPWLFTSTNAVCNLELLIVLLCVSQFVFIHFLPVSPGLAWAGWEADSGWY